MIPVFATAVKMKYYLVESDKTSGLPDEGYPPSNIAQMIAHCEKIGRKDLADQIKMQWAKVLNKYPGTRVNWGAATKIGTASIKKNIFAHQEFSVWLDGQKDVPAEDVKAAKSIPTIIQPPKGTPPLAIPKNNETAEQWQEEAAKTKEALASAKKAFADVKEYIIYLEKSANDLKRKIADYGPGGSKSKTKSGESKFAARLPKWEAELKGTLAQLEETKNEIKDAEGSFKKAVNDYNHAPLTTVAYEKKVQDGLENILTNVLNMKDLDKQRELLTKINEYLGKKESTGEVVAAADQVMSLFKKFKEGIKRIQEWIKGLNKSVGTFSKLASIRY